MRIQVRSTFAALIQSCSEALRDVRAVRARRPQTAARLWSPASGRALEVLTTAPGLGLYTGNALDGSVAGKGGARYPRHGGVVLQAQARHPHV